MATKYLDKDGLTYLWTKIKTYINNAIKVTGVKGSAESSYRTGNINLTAENVQAIKINSPGNTQQLLRPNHLNGLNDNTLDAKVNTLRANRLAFLPADQIIIEQTTDGGVTWVDAGIADYIKIGLFSETRPTVRIPLLNGVKNLKCGIRITFTAMKYNVPDGTAETEKYNYWNSTYVKSCERYNQLKEMYFWVSTSTDTVSIKLERASGANSTNWSTVFQDASWGATGWSGCDYIRFSQGVFGGSTSQTSNYWNYRLTFMTRGVGGGTEMATTYTTATQTIMEIRGYGDTWWTAGNEYAANDKIYTHDYIQNVTFPKKVTATNGFVGALTGNVTGNVNGHTINSDVPANAVFTDTTYESKPAASGGTALSLVTTGDKYRWDVAASGGGDVNVIETVKVNGTALTPDANKAVNVILPSNLLNGSATGSLRSIGSQTENSNYTIGTNSLALGVGTLAASQTQIALGKYNVSDSNNTYAVIIGNGTANNARSNALTIDWNGNVSIGNSSKTSTYSIRTCNSLHDINLNANTSGNAGIWDSTTSSWMIYNDTNGKTYLGNSTQIYTDGSSLRSNTFYTNYNIYCGSAIGTGGRTSYTDISKSGDWITSDGAIDLVRSETSGGLIQFHYNYSSSVTSTIEEINSGVIHISGTLTAGQAIRSNASSTDYCKLNGHTAMVVGREESRIGAFISRGSSTEDLANNSIYLYANSQGRVGIYSIMQEDATAVTILSRENNSNTITFGNSAGNVLTYSYNYSSAPPIVSNTTANHRVSHFYMSTATQLMVYAQGNASSYAAYYITTSSSDIRLKENIQDTKVSALPVINSFKMREFDWKNGDGHQDIGMIADEIEKIDPKLTIGGGYDENGEMNIKTIDTFYLIGYLTKAVQELSAEIEELKKS